MSADLARKQTKLNSNGHVVLPQAVTNPSIIESVAGFIHEVVPQAYSSVLPGETRENISWARFEVTDYNDAENYSQLSECESESTSPLLLVLGYSTGVQVWAINGSGDATELLSWSQGAVRTLRLLDKPKNGPDLFLNKRPLVAVVDSSGPGPQFCTVNFVSLRTAEVLKSIKFKTPICDVLCNKKSIVITFSEKIAVFDVGTLEDRLTITTCYPSPGGCINPVALGPRWLAYAEKRLTTWQRSSGGCESDGSQSYTSTVIHAAKSLRKGLRDLSGSLTGSTPSATNNNATQPGVVTIMDIELKPTKEDDPENLICHFVGHVGPIVAMTFDPSGLLLVTADKHGHRFHVYRIQPHPSCPQMAAVHHLYILHRGETTARVQDIAVSLDSRWVAVSSVRGTTHVFPITPYGGPVTVRTHTTPHVVNRLSRFERSAGLSDGRGSPLPEVPCQPSTPRLPPFPVPCILLPLAQIRRTDESPLAAAFAVPRAWIPGQAARPAKRSMLDSLFVISTGGSLIQYDLEPKPIPGVAKDKISYDTAIELNVDAKAEWPLLRPPYSSNLQPPLPSNNPLLMHTPVERTADPRTTDDRWMSQVEIVTYTGPHRRLWMGPQFSFKAIDPLAASGFEMNSQNDNAKPTRSNPVNMPHRPFLLVESGSAGSVESPHMTDYGSSGEDIQHGESRLREDLADAMLETAANSSGVLVGAACASSSTSTATPSVSASIASTATTASESSSLTGGGRLRAAILERQVNPLGTVITLPSSGSSNNNSGVSAAGLVHDQMTSQQHCSGDRRLMHQFYHEVLPVSYQLQSYQKLSSSSKKSSDNLHAVTDESTTKTCVEVQTVPFHDDDDTSLRCHRKEISTKSIQTVVHDKKLSEHKVKSKNKKKSTKNTAEDIVLSAGGGGSISEQKTNLISKNQSKQLAKISDSVETLKQSQSERTDTVVSGDVDEVTTTLEDSKSISVGKICQFTGKECHEEEIINFSSITVQKSDVDEGRKEVDLLTGDVEPNLVATLAYTEEENDENILATEQSPILEYTDRLVLNESTVSIVENDNAFIVTAIEQLDDDIGEHVVSHEEQVEKITPVVISTDGTDKRCKKDTLVQKKLRSPSKDIDVLVASSKESTEHKRQSPKIESPKDDTESSDEPNSKASDSRSNSLKLVKRKKTGKKSSEDLTINAEELIEVKSPEFIQEVERSDYETCSEKKSDSSVESFPDFRRKTEKSSSSIHVTEHKSWSAIVKNLEKEPVRPTNSAEDRDSVYESCNDEDFPALNETVVVTSGGSSSVQQQPQQQQQQQLDQTAFESSKEEFEEQSPLSSQQQAATPTGAVKLTDSVKIESGSSNTEEKTDSGDKDLFTSIKNLKKVKKQKKRKR